MITMPIEPPVTEYLHAKAARLGIPISGTFELTPCCNMSCKMCYVRMTTAEQRAIAPLKTAEEWLNFGKECRDNGLLYLLLTGGEPFLRPDFRQIYQGLYRLGFLMSINTNGTLIDEEVVSWLKETPPTRVNVTLYGTSDETYARLCGNPHGYSQAVHGIKLLLHAGISVQLNCSLTPDNVNDFSGIYAFAKENHLQVRATSYMFPPIRRDAAMIGENRRFTAMESAYQSARIICESYGEDWFLDRMTRDLPPIPSESGDDCPDIPGEGIRCRAGKCSFWVTWNGRLTACGMLPADHAPDAFSSGFASAWQQVRTAAAAIRLPSKCATCEARDNCKACAAMVYGETGSFDKVPVYRCEMTKHYPAACRKLEKEIQLRRINDDET